MTRTRPLLVATGKLGLNETADVGTAIRNLAMVRLVVNVLVISLRSSGWSKHRGITVFPYSQDA
ncbi:hypothetical protein OAV85_01845 [Candidatus Nanopelagicales bacterium]|nr:hypothetical protein [Candidatus Nanopelagicales bacterium]